MTTTAERRETAEEAYERIRAEIAAIGPDAAKLVGQLSDTVSALEAAAEKRAVRWQGKVIMAAITGDLDAWPDCQPDWANMPPAPADWR